MNSTKIICFLMLIFSQFSFSGEATFPADSLFRYEQIEGVDYGFEALILFDFAKDDVVLQKILENGIDSTFPIDFSIHYTQACQTSEPGGCMVFSRSSYDFHKFAVPETDVSLDNGFWLSGDSSFDQESGAKLHLGLWNATEINPNATTPGDELVINSPDERLYLVENTDSTYMAIYFQELFTNDRRTELVAVQVNWMEVPKGDILMHSFFENFSSLENQMAIPQAYILIHSEAVYDLKGRVQNFSKQKQEAHIGTRLFGK